MSRMTAGRCAIAFEVNATTRSVLAATTVRGAVGMFIFLVFFLVLGLFFVIVGYGHDEMDAKWPPW